ncbi:MAG: shikimate dehydrogenase [Bacteroidales bacterium]
MKRLFGLIGYPLGHSWSKSYFDKKFLAEKIHDAEYQLFPVKDLSLLKTLPEIYPSLQGLNVTIPYKISILPYLDFIDPVAGQVNAVNVVKIIRAGSRTSLHGFNSDVVGFERSIKPLLKSHHRSALILGTGGASRAAAWVFTKLGISYVYVSRDSSEQLQIGYDELDNEIMEKHTIIVNATPLGMAPDIHSKPQLPYHLISDRHLMFDMVYNPTETAFLESGRKRGATIKNGLEMLHIQAEESWLIWNDLSFV